jgi:hypothetical protein
MSNHSDDMKGKYLVLLPSLATFLFACHKSVDSPASGHPGLTTAAITAITDTAATAGGTWVAPGVTPLLYLGVDLATDSLFHDATTYTSPVISTGSYTVNLTRLYPGITYYVRAVAYTTLHVMYYGDSVFFTTPYTPGKYNVTTLAGTEIPGFDNGADTDAKFFGPSGCAVDGAGNIYVADNMNKAIRLITPAGVVSTFAPTDATPNDVVTDNQGNVYVAEGFKILKITPGGQVSTFAGSGVAGAADGTGAAASFSGPLALSIDTLGNIYVADSKAFRKVTPTAAVTTLTDYFGPNDRRAAIAVDNHLNFYETNAQSVIKIDSVGNKTSLSATFSDLTELRADASGNIYATDALSNKVWMISPAGVVSDLAGNGAYGDRDGNSAIASFGAPIGLAPDGAGNIIVCDNGNNKIRKISPN